MRAKLLRLVLVCIVPVSLAAAAAIVAVYRESQASLVAHARADARALSLATDAELGRAVAALQGLATSPAIVSQDWARFRAQALQVLSQQDGSHIVVTSADNRQALNTLRAEGTAAPEADSPARLMDAIAADKPVASDLYLGAAARRPLLAVAVPVHEDERIPYYLALAFRPERLAAPLASAPLAGEAFASIVDGAGMVVMRTGQAGTVSGRPALPALREAMAHAPEGVIDGDMLDGVPVFAAYVRSPMSGWTVVVGMPQATLLAALGPWVVGLLVISLSLLLIAVYASRRMADRIERSIAALIPPAAALGEGAPVAVQAQGLAEVDAVGAALTRAAGLLSARTAERDEATRGREAMRARSQRLAHAASHDALTGLLNRARFGIEIEARLADARRGGGRLTLCFIDIDDFKPVNDLHGHAVGDELLHAFAQRLRDGVRASDPVARLGGDEFAVLLDGMSPHEAMPVAQTLIDRLSRPYAVRQERIVISACIGLAGFPDHAETAGKLLEQADAAMYRGKQAGKRHCTVSGFMDL
ncbi:GGDEF domain-containing protein [Ideonella sp.]|uniref:GGDEF domain-containing protein n=1 Tax=Ideonella sp. TaxID=1929293 RepID=UPI002B497373|nr:GGDEF domain-containing protein [Ideonella sp.]HJV70168.1 GGDEF domain-containing protein [Ideonella sp.]